MEDGVSHTAVVETTTTTNTTPRSPPPPPDPNVNDAAAAVPLNPTLAPKSDTPLQLDSEAWDINSLSALGAVRMLMETLEKLAEATGDVPPTPPVSRPSTPKKANDEETRRARRLSSTPRTAAGAADIPNIPHIGSPEAQPTEPITVDISVHAEEITLQHAALARRFFSKVAPPFTLTEYLSRIHHYCPHSPGVYLAAAAYIHTLCVSDLLVPATSRTIHRLSLAAIRVAAKTLEDNKWAQERVAKVGGVSNNQLMNLELTLCYLLDFDLFVDEGIMARRGFLLQQAARNGAGARGRLNEQFKLKLPLRRKGTK